MALDNPLLFTETRKLPGVCPVPELTVNQASPEVVTEKFAGPPLLNTEMLCGAGETASSLCALKLRLPGSTVRVLVPGGEPLIVRT